MEITDAEDLRRGGSNTQKSYAKKILMIQITMITHHSPRARHCGMQSQVDPMDCSTPGFPVHHQLPELTQTHVHRGSDAI